MDSSTPTTPNGRSTDELRDFATEHLAYEVRMLARLADYIAEKAVDKALAGEADEGMPVRNAMIESFAVHMRALNDFFYMTPNPDFPDDILATDYVPTWKPPNRTQNLARPNMRRVGREIAHLSFGRLGIPAQAKEWNIGAIRIELGAVIRKFADDVPGDLVELGFKTEVEELFPAQTSASLLRSKPSTVIADATVNDQLSVVGTATQMIVPNVPPAAKP